MTVRQWTPERIDRLKELAAAGLTVTEIANELGMPRSTVGDNARRVGISFGAAEERSGHGAPWSSSEKATLMRIWCEAPSRHRTRIACKELPGRTIAAIKLQVEKLSIGDAAGSDRQSVGWKTANDALLALLRAYHPHGCGELRI